MPELILAVAVGLYLALRAWTHRKDMNDMLAYVARLETPAGQG